MSIGEVCNREVIVIGPDASVREAARLMRDYHVGDLVIVEQRGQQRVPLGVLTDRDIVIEVLAEDIDQAAVTIRDVMSTQLISAREDEDLADVIERMRAGGVRRVPVVNAQGGLEGILAVDDVLELLAEQTSTIARLVRIGQQHERARSQGH
jgi:CBS domain-containing protein